MAIQSMTGFGRAAGQHAGTALSWELRSVNGKGLEVRLRLPSGLERLEPTARQAIQKRFSRGNIQASLNVVRSGVQVQPVVNEAFMEQVAELARRLVEQHGCAPAAAHGILALPGVLQVPETIEAEDDRAAFDRLAVELLEEALDGLQEARKAEGGALRPILAGHLDTIEELTLEAEKDPVRQPDAIRARIAHEVGLLIEAAPALDEARLAMEAAFLATRADIGEEIDRLKAHIGSGRQLLHGGGTIGRKLDFLSQEFNREANTLCSKSNAASLSATGLKMKAVVDRLREQVQNLE